MLVHGHWGQTTTLGATVIAAGLALAAVKFNDPRQQVCNDDPACLTGSPASFGTASMPRFAGMIRRGMEERGYQVETWTSKPRAGRMAVGSTLFANGFDMLTNSALSRDFTKTRPATAPRHGICCDRSGSGMWVPCLSHRHVIHCHDFLALKSAARVPGEPHRLDWASISAADIGKVLERDAFISVSEKTRRDLHRFCRLSREFPKWFITD